MDCSLPGSSVLGDSPGENPGVGCHFLLQGIFTTQGLNPGLPHCRQILYYLSHQGSPDDCKITTSDLLGSFVLSTYSSLKLGHIVFNYDLLDDLGEI